MTWLLHTKTRLPPIRKQHTHRQRLVQRIAARTDTRLILVSAPAGFGKSSCLVEWAYTMREAGAQVAWYALDEQDNDPARFAAYFINAFRSADDRFAPLFPEGAQTDLPEAVVAVVNAAAQHDGQIALVLDDYHLITAPPIHDAISRMCDYLPPNMRIAIGTRADPPLQLARLRARGEITELRMMDLRFSRDEMAALLRAALGWIPSQQVLDELAEVTEGWAAALSLIIMALDSHTHTVDEQALKGQLAGYSRTQRHIFDYFAAEVLRQQPAEIRRFLLDTCVLDRLSPSVCSALTNDANAPLLLEQIAATSLFVIPLSASQPVYRYHHLFEQFLRQQVQLADRARYLAQHHAAAVWYMVNDNVGDAVNHALAAEDYAYAASLIESAAWETLTSRGELVTILGWLQRFPQDALTQHPRLCLYFSRALYLTGDIEHSEVYIQIAASALERTADRGPEQQALQAIVANYQATLAAYRGKVRDGLALNQRAAVLSHTVDALDQVRIVNTAAYLHLLQGDVTAARESYERALALAEAANHHYLILDAQSYLAQVDLMAGDLRQARARCEQVLAQYDMQIAPLSVVMLPLARAYFEQNQLVEAEATTRNALTLARRGYIPDALWAGYILLAGVLSARREHDDALACIQHARQIAGSYSSPAILSVIDAAEAKIMLHCGRVDEAGEWAETYQQSEPADYLCDFEDFTLARVWLAQQQTTRALTLLVRVVDAAQAAGRSGHVIEGEVLRALAYQSAGQPDAALNALGRALTLAEAQGYVRVFLDGGAPILALLRRIAAMNTVPAFAKYLLATAQRTENVRHPADTLTEREIEVLARIAAGASNQEIAEALVISLGTVKSHIHHIMSKLDAQNRTEAVARARSLNILTD